MVSSKKLFKTQSHHKQCNINSIHHRNLNSCLSQDSTLCTFISMGSYPPLCVLNNHCSLVSFRVSDSIDQLTGWCLSALLRFTDELKNRKHSFFFLFSFNTITIHRSYTHNFVNKAKQIIILTDYPPKCFHK